MSLQETTLYGATIKVHEPVGVIAIVCPDEYPLLSFVSLLAPAVVRANCVVIVPSEKYPLPALNLYQVGNLNSALLDCYLHDLTTTTILRPFSGNTRVSRCQKRTSGLYGARED